MTRFKSMVFVLCFTLLVTVIAGCSGKGNNNSNNPSSPSASPVASPTESGEPSASETPQFSTDPVTLTFYYPWGQEGFDAQIKKPVQDKYPNITLNFVEALNDEDITQGIVPDIVYLEGVGFMDDHWLSKNLKFDLQPLVDKYGVDLGKVQPNIMKDIMNRGGLVALPLTLVPNVLHYNKDIFDKLGVDYPRDGMTWDEIIDLAKQLTRNEGGVQYRGLDYDYPFSMLNQFPLNVPDKVEPTFTNMNKDYYSKWLDRVKSILQIPGNYPSDPDQRSGMMLMWGDAFINKKDVAMYPQWDLTSVLAEAEEKGSGFNWDIATFPQLPENMGVMPPSYSHVLAISPVSKNTDTAFQVLTYLVGEEYQSLMSKKGWGATVLTDAEVQSAYRTEDPRFKDKNIAAFFKLAPAPTGDKAPVKNHEFDVLWNGMYEFAKLQKDNNTLLQEWQDQAEKMILENAGK